MKNLRLIVAAATMALCLAACKEEPAIDKVQGTYKCNLTEYTQYQKDGRWRDTAFVYHNDGTLTIKKLSDSQAEVTFSSTHGGEGSFAAVEVKDWNYIVNLSGTGSVKPASSSYTYEARLSGSVNTDFRDLAISAALQDVSPKRIFSFTNN